jgi:PAS domain S-box-containing protein
MHFLPVVDHDCGKTMFKFRHLSIRRQILLLAFIVAIPAMSTIIYSGVYMRRTALASAKLETERLAGSIAAEQQNLVAAAQQLITVMVHLPEVKARNRKAMTELLVSILKLNPHYSNLLIADKRGYVWDHGLPTASTFNAHDRRYFRNAMTSGRISSGEYIRSRLTSKPVFNLASAFKNERDGIEGVFVVAFMLDYYRQTLLRSRLPDDASFMLLDHSGFILYSTVEPERFIGSRYDPVPFGEMVKGPDAKTDVGYMAVSGAKGIISYRKLWLPGEDSPYLYIRVSVPVREVLSGANAMLIRNIIFFTLFLFAAIGIAWFVGKRSIADRLSMLEEVSRKMAEGDLNIKPSGLEEGGEIGKLGQTFAYMAEKLKIREKALVESERNYKTIFNTNKDALFIHDASTGIIMEVNNTVTELFGYSHEEIIGKDVTCLSSGEESFTSKEAGELIVKTFKEGARTFEWQAKRKDGSLFWAEVILSSAKINDVDCVIAAVRDMSERKEAEEER